MAHDATSGKNRSGEGGQHKLGGSPSGANISGVTSSPPLTRNQRPRRAAMLALRAATRAVMERLREAWPRDVQVQLDVDPFSML